MSGSLVVRFFDNAVVLTLLTILLWSTVATAFKLALNDWSPLIVLFFSAFFSWVFLLFSVIWQGQLFQSFLFFKQQPLRSFLLGVCNPFLYFWVLFEAFRYLPAQQAQAIIYSWPMLLCLFAFFLKEVQLQRKAIVALLVAYAGVILVISQGSFNLASLPLYGFSMALLSTVIWALYWLITKQLQQPPLIALFIHFSIGLPFIVLAVLILEPIPVLNLHTLALCLHIGLFEMGFTFLLWLRALRIGDNIALLSNLTLLTPFFSMMIIASVLKEPIHWSAFMGLFLIVTAVFYQQNEHGKVIDNKI